MGERKRYLIQSDLLFVVKRRLSIRFRGRPPPGVLYPVKSRKSVAFTGSIE